MMADEMCEECGDRCGVTDGCEGCAECIQEARHYTNRARANAWLGLPEDTPLPPRIVMAICDPDPDLIDAPDWLIGQIAAMTNNDRDQVVTFLAFLQARVAAARGEGEAGK